MNFIKYISISFVVLLFIGCGDSPVFSKKIKMDGSWTYANELSFPFQIDAIESSYDLVFALTYGTDFGYQNIYVKIITEYPDGNTVEDILSLNLTDGAGLFLGDCSSTTCEIDILLQEKFKFKEQGDYVITIIQNGREENLNGIFAAELKLYQVLQSE